MAELKTLIPSTTEAAVSEPITLYEGGQHAYPGVPVTVWAWDLAAGEEIEIQFPTDKVDPDAWETVEILDTDNLNKAIYSPVTFRVSKPATATAAGVAMSRVRGL